MHSPGKGMASSALPYKRTPPAWLKISAQGESRALRPIVGDVHPHIAVAGPAALALLLLGSYSSCLFALADVEDHVCKLAKKGLTPSQIGVILRDSNGIAQVSSVTGSKILRLLKKNGMAPDLPEDLYYLIKRAVSMRKHLERNRADKDSKFRLILVESRIHRLARYYRKVRKLEPNWRYESATASALVSS